MSEQNRTLSHRTFYIHTFGCQMNVRESQTAQGILEKEGLFQALSEESADVILFNTCCIRELAEQKAWTAIGATKKIKEQRPHVIVGVFGCMMAEEGNVKELKQRFPFVDFALGTNSLHELPAKLWMAAQGFKSRTAEIGDAAEEFDLPAHHNAPPLAFINIIHGCNNFCTYCIVPYVRGREKSRPLQLILDEAAMLREKGYKEITLLGQNVNSYGNDSEDDLSFAKLLRALDKTGIERIRFMTSHPKDLSDEMIEAMAECDHVCKQIHLPVQSGSNEILRAMNRKYTREHYLSLVEKLRSAMPDVGITTDLIAGFPGESEKDHQDTLELMQQVRFDASFTFAFSPRKGTPAAKMEDAVPQEVKQRRLAELIERQKKDSQALYQTLLNTTQRVLVEGAGKKDSHQATGKIDRGRTVNFDNTDQKAKPGDFVEVKITQAKANTLLGERC